MKETLSFRAWFYFRQGYGLYFAFILAGINTLTITYFLAIENYPILKEVFPTFITYVIIVAGIGIPLLIGVGYFHFKRTEAFRSESAINFESNPFSRRMLVNTELTLKINQELIALLLKMQKGEKTNEEALEHVQKTQSEINKLVEKRTIFSKEDLDFLKKLQEDK
jgi:hypothetical protein